MNHNDAVVPSHMIIIGKKENITNLNKNPVPTTTTKQKK